MRHFRHLTRAQITEIIVLHNGGAPQAEIARRFEVDHSTINYHLKKYEAAYPEQGGIYSLIKIEKARTCLHPSSKCTLCGEMRDEIRREETETITKLKRQLESANYTLRVHGLAVESVS